MDCLLCEKCGRIYPNDHDGIRCEEPDCDGHLIPINLALDHFKED